MSDANHHTKNIFYPTLDVGIATKNVFCPTLGVAHRTKNVFCLDLYVINHKIIMPPLRGLINKACILIGYNHVTPSGFKSNVF